MDIYLDWVHVRFSRQSISCTKLEKSENGKLPQLMWSFEITSDRTWVLLVKEKAILWNAQVFSSAAVLSQFLFSVEDIVKVLSFLDKCVICCGNNDPKFQGLATFRNGKFMNKSGKLYTIIIDMVEFFVYR